MRALAGAMLGAVLTVGVLLAVANGLSPISWLLGNPEPPPPATVHEGKVSRIVVDDPHDGGWSGRESSPRTVIMTVSGRVYDLDGSLRQAASVKLGDTVRIECTSYEWDPNYCEFAGIVLAQPTEEQPS